MVYRFTEVVIDSRTGLNPRKNFVLGGGDNYYITIKDIYNGKVNLTDKTDKVDDKAIQIIKRRSRIKVGDVLFVSIGRIGETAIVKNKDNSWDVNESVFVFTLNDKIITPEYFCTVFQSQGVKQYLSGNSSGSTFKSIKMNQLERMTFDLPPVPTQENITAKLAAVRQIINLRTSQLAKLDNLVKARFVELFGDPVNNEKNWPTEVLDGVCSTIVDCPHSTPSYTAEDTGYMCIRTSIVKKNYIAWDKIEYIPEDEYVKRIQRKRPEKGDIVYTREGAILGIAAIIDRDCNVALGKRSMLLSPNTNKCMPQFLSVAMNFDSFLQNIIGGISGSASPHINVGEIKRFSIILPPIEIQKQFAAFVEQVDKLKAAVQKALDEAQLLFDSLMQKYFG